MKENKNSNADTFKKDFQKLREIASDLINENADLKNKLDERSRELDLLYKVIRQVAYSMEWNEIQEIILEIIMENFRAVRFCLLGLFDESDNQLIIRIKTRLMDKPVTERLTLPFPIDETTKWDEVIVSNEWFEFSEKIREINEIQSSFIPLTMQEKHVGFLMVGKEKNVEYVEGEWQFLNTIAHHFAVALDNSRLYLLAITDGLTGLFNRRYFLQRLEREIEKSRRRNIPISLLMLDIDNFKRVNDTHGHPVGDQVIAEISNRLKETVSDKGIICRYGGEEFAVLLIDADWYKAHPVAEAIRANIADSPIPVTSDGKRLSVNITISIGVSCCPTDSKDLKKLIYKADQALYLAKAQGRNKVV
ncbi:MAG: sensor domain-containing diguanylate cyclase [bacterium]